MLKTEISVGILKLPFPMSSTIPPQCSLTWMLRLELQVDVAMPLFSHWYFFLSDAPFFSPWTWRPLKMALLFVTTFRKIHMFFNSSRLSPQKILNTVSSWAYCTQIVVLYSQRLCKFSPSFLAYASSIFFFFKSFGYTKLPHVILCIHHLCFFSFPA